MQNYRLKKEAVQFFKEKYATKIYPFDTWESIGADMNALELVDGPYIRQGIKLGENSLICGGWDNNGSRFEFTIVYPSVKFYEHDKFTNGRMTRELMDKIQHEISNFFNDFVNGENKE